MNESKIMNRLDIGGQIKHVSQEDLEKNIDAFADQFGNDKVYVANSEGAVGPIPFSQLKDALAGGYSLYDDTQGYMSREDVQQSMQPQKEEKYKGPSYDWGWKGSIPQIGHSLLKPDVQKAMEESLAVVAQTPVIPGQSQLEYNEKVTAIVDKIEKENQAKQQELARQMALPQTTDEIEMKITQINNELSQYEEDKPTYTVNGEMVPNMRTLFNPNRKKLTPQQAERKSELEKQKAALGLQKRFLDKTKEYEEYDKGGDYTKLGKLFRGLAVNGDLQSFAMMGLDRMYSDQQFRAILDKAQKMTEQREAKRKTGDLTPVENILTPDEQKAMLLYQNMLNIASMDRGSWFRAGEGLYNTFEFMRDMALAGMGGGFGSLAKMSFSQALKQTSKNLLKKGIEVAWKTPLLPGFYSNLSKNMTENYTIKNYGTNLKPRWYVGQEDSLGRTLYETWAQQSTEYFTEALGGALSSLGMLRRVAQSASKSFAILEKGANLYDKIYKKTLSTTLGKYAIKGLKSVGLDNAPMEFVEEIANVPLQSLMLWENQMDQLLDPRFYQEVAITTAALGGMGSAIQIMAGGTGAAIERSRSNKAIMDATEYIRTAMDNSQDDALKSMFNDLLTHLEAKDFYDENGKFTGQTIIDDINNIAAHGKIDKELFGKAQQLVKEKVAREGQTQALKAIMEDQVGKFEYGTSGDVVFGINDAKQPVFILDETEDAYVVNDLTTKETKMVPKSSIQAGATMFLDEAVTNYFVNNAFSKVDTVQDVEQAKQEAIQQSQSAPLQKGSKATYNNQPITIEDIFTDANGQTMAIVSDADNNTHNVPLSDLVKVDDITTKNRYILPDGKRAIIASYETDGTVVLNVLDDANNIVGQQRFTVEEFSTFEKLPAQQANMVEGIQGSPQQGQTPQPQPAQPAVQYKTDENGKRIWSSAPAEVTKAEIDRKFNGQDAIDYVQAQIAYAQQMAKQAEALQPQSLDMDKRAEELQAISEQRKAAQTELAYWNSVLGLYTAASEQAKAMQPILDRIAQWEKGGIKFTIINSESEVTSDYVLQHLKSNPTITGWFDPKSGSVFIYMPNVKSVDDVDATVVHEAVSHKGLRALMGEDRYNAFCQRVFDEVMTEQQRAYYMAYPGVDGNAVKAADEYIAYLSEKVNLTPDEQTVWDKIVEMFREALEKALNIILNKETITNEDIADLIRMSYANIKKQTTPDVIHQDDSTGQALFSMRTYREGGRDKLIEFVDKRKADGALTADQAADIVSQMDQVYALCENYLGVYQPFGAWSEAEVAVDDSGKPVFSVIKANGDYDMNLDFSLVCKKRRTLDAVFDEMIRRGIISEYELGQLDIALINSIIRKYNFETACRLCFVDSRRFQVAAVADRFCALYNSLAVMNESQLDKVIASEEKKTVRKKAAIHLKYNPQDRVLLSRDNFISANGFEGVSINRAEVMKLYNSAKGTGGPKASLGDVQYLNDIIGKNWTPERAYAVGGVRLQSFSDYIPRMVFDYIQMIAELAAKHLPVHCYTKESIFVKQFGLTGIKINMSLVPRVDADGVAAGLDKDGNYAWQDGETFPYEEAIAIQNTPGYMQNCGTIAVGVSDRHIRKMLSDENIRMIIPYHKSGLNKQVAIFNNIDKFTDYTKVQNTRYANGNALSAEDKANHFDFNGDLLKNQDPRGAAQRYLDWCDQNNYLPKFDQFRDHPNYYKLLEDFTTIVTQNGVDAVVPQLPVQMRFPSENDAFGSMTSLIQQGLEEDAILEGRRSENLPAIVDEIQTALDEQKAAKKKAVSKKKNSKKKQNEVMFRTNAKFNEDLQKQIDGTLPTGYVYQIGMPGNILKAAGFPDMPIELLSTRLAEKSVQKNHPFSLSDVKDLVLEINNPLAVFNYGNNAKNVIVDIELNGKQFLIGVHFNQTHRGVEVSDIRGIFPKDNAEWLNWIIQDKANYLDKQKIQALIDKQRINLAEVEYLDLDLLTKVINDFVNPTIVEQESSDQVHFRSAAGKDITFRQIDITGKKLRELEDGEFSHVERIFTESKYFDFTSKEKIESANDVAYIFSQLEDESVENAFAVLVKDGNPYVIHIGMGGFDYSMFNMAAVVAADKLIDADQVYMVHNHPSGALRASDADLQGYKKFRQAFGAKLQDGVIINLTSGKFAVFNESESAVDYKESPDSEVPVKVYAFNKQVFDVDYNPLDLAQISSSVDVASFVSSHRLGDRAKLSSLILNRQNRVVGNVFLPFSSLDLDQPEINYIAGMIADYVIKMGGTSSIVYGSGVDVSNSKVIKGISDKVKELSGQTVNILDWIYVKGNAQRYKSANDEGVVFRAKPFTEQQYQEFEAKLDEAHEGKEPKLKVPENIAQKRSAIYHDLLRQITDNPYAVVTYDTFAEIMGDYGVDQDDIDEIQDAIKHGGFLPVGLYLDGVMYFYANNILSIDELRLSLAHERQHGITLANWDYYKGEILAREPDIEKLRANLDKLTRGKQEWSNADEDILIGEFISNAIEYAYEYDNLDALADLGINEKLIDFIKKIDNEQRSNNDYSRARRQKNVRKTEQGGVQQNEGDQGPRSAEVEQEGFRASQTGQATVGPEQINSYENTVRFRNPDYTPEMEQIKATAEKDGTFMKAPNGQPTKLNERQWLQVRTDAFKKWFGDWINDPESASKVVDTQTGEPKVVYHGTGSEFWEFKYGSDANELGAGYYFTDDEVLARRYAEDIELADNQKRLEDLAYDIFIEMGHQEDELYDNEYVGDYNKAYDQAEKELFGQSNVMPVFLNIRNPYLLEDINPNNAEHFSKRFGNDGIIDTAFAQRHEVLSTDGVQYVVFKPNQVKSAIENTGEFSTESNDIRFRSVPVFQSNAEKAAIAVKQDKATPLQWMAMLKNNGGLKAGEDKWIGLSDWLNQQSGTVTKQQVLDYIRENQIQIIEVNYAANPTDGKKQAEAIRQRYSTKGLSNYGEIALAVPNIKSWKESDITHFGDAEQGRAVVWARFGETIDKDGNSVLVIDEIQSNRHQKGREKGYVSSAADLRAERNDAGVWNIYKSDSLVGEIPASKAETPEAAIEYYVKNNLIPDAPFEKNWHEVAMKRMLRYAADNGFNKIAWTTGAQQGERYNMVVTLSRFEAVDVVDIRTHDDIPVVKEIVISNDSGSSELSFITEQGKLYGGLFDGMQLSDVVGKSMAEKLMAPGKVDITDNVYYGAEGMKSFYDKMLVDYMNKYGKKWGVKVEDVFLPELRNVYMEKGITMHSVKVTDAMRNSMLDESQVLFRSTPVFQSNAEKAALAIKQDKATPLQWLAMLKNNGGLKAGEDKWIGLSDWLNQQSGTVTKQQVLDYIRENQIIVVDQVYIENDPTYIFKVLHQLNDEYQNAGWDTLSDKYPGFEDLFVVVNNKLDLAKDPLFDDEEYFDFVVQNKLADLDYSYKYIDDTRLGYTTTGLDSKKEIALVVPSVRSWGAEDEVHFGDAGGGRAVAWARFGNAIDQNGNSVLVIDEVQSKRHQDAREQGYASSATDLRAERNRGDQWDIYRGDELVGVTPAWEAETPEQALEKYTRRNLVPDAPFEKNWHEVAMKRMLRYAAENGFDKIAWTTGQQQAERYNLSNVVREFNSVDDNVSETQDGVTIVKRITMKMTSGLNDSLNVTSDGKIYGGEFNGRSLAEVVGKDVAEVLMEPGDFIFKPGEISIGGEGMKAFYDKMLVDFMNKYGKKWGVKVEDVYLPALDDFNGVTMHSIEVTDAMKDSVLNEPQVMFRSAVTPSDITSKGLRGTIGEDGFQTMVGDIVSSLPVLETAADIKRGMTPEKIAAKMLDDYLNSTDDVSKGQDILFAIKDALTAQGAVIMPEDGELLYQLWKDLNPSTAVTIKEKLQDAAKAADVRFRAAGQRQAPATNEVKLTRSQLWQERLVDRMIAVKILYDQMKKIGITISDDTNPYITENLAMSRVQTEDTQFKKQIYTPLIDKVMEVENLFIELGLAANQQEAYKAVGEFLYARHAPERNKNICCQEVVDMMLRAIGSKNIELFKDANVRESLMAFASRMYNEKSNPSTPKTAMTFAKTLLKDRGADAQQQAELNAFRIRFVSIILTQAQEQMDRIFASDAGTNRSGMTDQDARVIMNRLYTPQTQVLLDELSNHVRRATHFTIDTWLKYSLVNEQTAQNLKGMYRYYIPLRSWEEKEDVDYSQLATQAFNHASEIINLNRKADGRKSKADDPLPYIASLAQSAIVVGNKNMIRLSLYRLIKANENNPALAQFATLPKVYYVETPGSDTVIAYDERPAQELFDQDLVRTKSNKSYKWHKSSAEYDAHIVPVILNGTRQMIELRGELGIKVASAINNTNVVHWQAANALKPVTNWLSAVRTSYNPEFVLVNFIRDFFFATTVYPTEGGSDVQLVKNLGHAFKSIHRLSTGKSVNTQWDAYYQEFLQQGGQTGFFAMRNIDTMKSEIEDLHKLLGGKGVNTQKIKAFGENVAAYCNNMSESAMRLAVYITEREKGTSPKEAAYKAHEITVNFNRKGTWSGIFGGFYSFFNASIQGTARLFSWANAHKKQAAVTLATMALAKLGAGLLAAAIGGDDYDELSDYVKFSNIVIPIGEDDKGKMKFLCIPMPQGIRAVTNISDNIVEVLRGNKTIGQAMGAQLANTVGEFLPLSFDAIDLTGRNTSYSIATVFAPTAIQPWMDVWVNMDFKGDPIYKVPFSPAHEGKVPEYKNVYGNANPVLVGVSRYLNRMAGGTDERSSSIRVNAEGDVKDNPIGYMLDFNPAKAEHLLNAYFGGLMSFPSNVIKTGYAVFSEDADVEYYNTPVVNRFVKQPFYEDGYSSYYQIREMIQKIDYSIKAAKKTGDHKAAATIKKRNARLLQRYEVYDKRVKQLQERLKKDNLSAEQRQTLQKSLDELVKSASEKLNEILKDEENRRD